MNGIADYLKEYEQVFDDVFVPEEEPEEGALTYLEAMPNLRGGVCEQAPNAGLDYDKIGAYVGRDSKEGGCRSVKSSGKLPAVIKRLSLSVAFKRIRFICRLLSAGGGCVLIAGLKAVGFIISV